jgi:hypothetical protein
VRPLVPAIGLVGDDGRARRWRRQRHGALAAPPRPRARATPGDSISMWG